MSRRARSVTCARAGILAALLLPGCGGDPRQPLDLGELEGTSNLACSELIYEAVELSGELHGVLMDAEGRGGWALISLVGQSGPRLALERLPASEDELETPFVVLGFSPQLRELTELRAGSSPGEIWAFIDAPEQATLVRAAPEQGELVRNELLSNFPLGDPSGFGCPSAYTRELIILSGVPHVLALPDCSETPGLTLELLTLDPELLNFGQNWQLEFDPCADTLDPAACALLLAYELPSIGRASATSFPDSTRAQAGFAQTRVFNQQVPGSSSNESHDIALLDMRMDADGPKARVITYREVWPGGGTPTQLGPVAIAEDFYSTQLFAQNLARDEDAALLRLDTALERYDQLRDPDLLPFRGRGQLVQLRDQGAIVFADEQGLRAIGLADIEGWGSWTEHTLSTLEDIDSFEPAGVGHLLVRREQAPPQLLRATLPLGGGSCSNESSDMMGLYAPLR